MTLARQGVNPGSQPDSGPVELGQDVLASLENHRYAGLLGPGVLAALLILFAFMGYSLWQSRLNHQHDAEVHSAAQAHLLKQYVHARIHEIDMSLLTAADEFRRLDVSGSKALTGHFGGFLKTLQARLPELDKLQATDGQGWVRYGREAEPAANINHANREYFQRARDQQGLVIAHPVFVSTTQQWVLSLARSLHHADGRFAGVVYADIPLHQFQKLFESIDVGKQGVIVLLDAHRHIIVRQPEPATAGSVIGQVVDSKPLRTLLEAGRTSATYEGQSRIDGIWRTCSYRPIDEYPLYLLVGLARQDYLAPWRQQVWIELFFLTIFLLTVSVMAWLLQRTWRLRKQAYADLSARDLRLDQLVIVLEQRERDLQAILDNMPAMIGYWDSNQRNRFGNHAYHAWFGLAQGRMQGMHHRELLGKELYQLNRSYIEATLRGEKQSFERHVKSASGELRHTVVHYIPDVVDGVTLGYYVMVFDITAIKEAQAALQRSEERYRHLFADAKVSMLLVEPSDGAIVDCNAAAAAFYGYDEARLRQMRVADLNEQAADQFPMDVNPASAGQRNLLLFAHRLASGEIRQVEVRSGPIEVDGRNLILSMIHDVTDRKLAEDALKASETRFSAVFHRSPVGIVISTLDEGRLVDVNPAFARLYGFERDELIGQNSTDLSMCTDPDERQQVVSCLHAEGRVESMELRFRRRGGSVGTLLLSAEKLELNGSLYLLGFFTDITARIEAEAGQRLAASFFANSQEGILVCDEESRIIDINPAFTGITGYSRQEVLGRNPSLLSSGRQTSNFYAEMWKSLNESGQWRGEIWNRRKSGEVYAQLLSISKVKGEHGEPLRYVAVFSDISPLKQHEAELDRIAHFDPLTNVPNRRLLSDRLDQALMRARRSGKTLAVCYLDLDGFKPINDQYGHEAGDQVLIEIAHRLQEVMRAEDTLARLGGDEFVLLFNGLEQEQEWFHALDRVLAAVATPMQVGEASVAMSASVGVALFPQDDVDADSLLRHADQAMYHAKSSGKNRYYLFACEPDLAGTGQRAIMQNLREAHQRGEFVLYYQPKVNLVTGEVLGVEAQLRWQHPERGLLEPADFLHYLSQSDFGIEIGEWVIETALDQLVDWKRAGLTLSVSTNIDAHHLQRGNFVERLRVALQRHPEVGDGELELEILESVAIQDLEHVTRTLVACQGMGVRFSLDDFGTGYSSLTYFRKLPVSLLKIDQSFVRDMLDDPEDLSIVESVVRLAAAFNRPVLAEGVESLEHGAMLVYLGCQLGQGNGIARSMPASELAGWMNRWQGQAVWREMVDARFPKEDVVLMVAASSHRSWIDQLADHIEGSTSECPPIHSKHCRFGRWYHGSCQVKYGDLAEFVALDPVHERIHVLASEMVDLVEQGQRDQAFARLLELYAQRDAFLMSLERLFERLSRKHQRPKS